MCTIWWERHHSFSRVFIAALSRAPHNLSAGRACQISRYGHSRLSDGAIDLPDFVPRVCACSCVRVCVGPTPERAKQRVAERMSVL